MWKCQHTMVAIWLSATVKGFYHNPKPRCNHRISLSNFIMFIALNVSGV